MNPIDYTAQTQQIRMIISARPEIVFLPMSNIPMFLYVFVCESANLKNTAGQGCISCAHFIYLINIQSTPNLNHILSGPQVLTAATCIRASTLRVTGNGSTFTFPVNSAPL